MAEKHINLHYKGYLLDEDGDCGESEHTLALIDDDSVASLKNTKDVVEGYNNLRIEGKYISFPEVLRNDVPKECFKEGVDESSGFGWESLQIPNCNFRFYWGDKKTPLEEAQRLFEEKLICGDYFHKGNDVGFSEFTITGCVFDEMRIGGHDLHAELLDKCGKYVHILIDFPV